MSNTMVHEKLTEVFLSKLEASRFLHIPLMNRIEARLKTRDELERYLRVLVTKLEEMDFRSEFLVDRVDRMVRVLEQLDGGGNTRAERQSDAEGSPGDDEPKERSARRSEVQPPSPWRT